MKIETLSVVVGDNACNAKCPFCVSQMTGKNLLKHERYNYRNLEKVCKFSQQNGVSTALITGKGEPMLAKDELISVCKELNKYFPFIELQTNGFLITESYLQQLYDAGLTTVILSMVHYDSKKNNEIYGYKTPLSLVETIRLIHKAGLSVRLSCIMVKGYIDNVIEVGNLAYFCKINEVEQLTIRKVEKPAITQDINVSQWTLEHQIDEETMNRVSEIFETNAKLVMRLGHGAKVYDYQGQNVCITNCLTLDPEDSTIRQLIVYPNGHVYYDWVYQGAILL